MDTSKIITSQKSVAVIVAHPDDETLWCGGTILLHPDANWFIACLCRKNDMDRAPKFRKVLKSLNATGIMGDLDDGPDQAPLETALVKKAILDLLPRDQFDLFITHNPSGEYTRHRRHEEIGKAVIELWHENKIATRELWTFAYEDGNRQYFPKKQDAASVQISLPEEIFDLKYKLITEVYGFPSQGFEAQTTPREEAFWKFETPADAFTSLDKESTLT